MSLCVCHTISNQQLCLAKCFHRVPYGFQRASDGSRLKSVEWILSSTIKIKLTSYYAQRSANNWSCFTRNDLKLVLVVSQACHLGLPPECSTVPALCSCSLWPPRWEIKGNQILFHLKSYNWQHRWLGAIKEPSLSTHAIERFLIFP